MAKTKSSREPSRLRNRIRNLVPAFLVSAAVLLVLEHWNHFEASDVVLLVLILAAVGVHVLVPFPDKPPGGPAV